MAVILLNTQTNTSIIRHTPPKKRRFIGDALLLTLITLTLRGLGTAFMVYISNKIGAEGMGLFQLTFSVYCLFITLATSGISLAVTRIVSEQMAVKNTVSAKSAFHSCILLSLFLSVVAGITLFSFATPIGFSLLKDTRTILSLKILSVGLPFLSVGSAVRGFFLGLKKGIRAASTDIVEQFVQMLITIPLLVAFSPKGLEASCCALVVGMTISEIVSCIYAIMLYRIEKIKPQGIKQNGITKQIFAITIPVAISYYIRSLLNSIENVLMPSGLKRYGQTSTQALSQYGMIKGMALPVLFFPSAVLSAFASLLVPEVSTAVALNQKKRIDYIVNKSIKTTLFFAFLITGLFLSFSDQISLAIYKNSAVGVMIFTLAPLIPLMYLDQIVDSILKGLNQQVSSMKFNTADSALRCTLIYFLVPVMGIKGYVIMLYAGTIFNALLSVNRLIVVSKVRFHLVLWVVLPCICIVVACVFTKYILFANAILSAIMIAICYLLLLIFTGCINKRDIAWVVRIFYRK